MTEQYSRDSELLCEGPKLQQSIGLNSGKKKISMALLSVDENKEALEVEQTHLPDPKIFGVSCLSGNASQTLILQSAKPTSWVAWLL